MTSETSIPETKEQFLERMAQVAMDEYWAWHKKASANWATPHMAGSVGWCGATLAVYAQALRDFKAHLMSGAFCSDTPEFFAMEADVFAAERGIDLTEGK